MVFCSVEFLIFFLAVAAAYWTLPWRWARLLPVGGARPILAYGLAGLVSASLRAASWRFDVSTAALANLPFGGELFWVAAVVLFGPVHGLALWARPRPRLAAAGRQLLLLRQLERSGWPV